MSDQDWQTQFRGWSTRELVHPGSPSGGGGTGAFRMPGYLDSAISSPVPSVGAPAGRFTEWRSILPQTVDPPRQAAEDAPMSGRMPIAAGAGAVTRIPVPGTNGLALELS